MFVGEVAFDLYSGDCFDKVVLFNSRIFVWKCSDGVYVFIVRDKISSLFFFLLFFFFLRECILYVCVSFIIFLPFK